MPGPTPKIQRPVLFGMQENTFSNDEPRIEWFPVDVSSQPVRWGDPVKQMAGGTVIRCTPSDTALLGFAAFQTTNLLPATIAVMPTRTDTSGRPLVPVYLADGETQFRAECSTTPTQAAVLQTHDLQYAVPDASAPTPTVTPQGTTGSTSYTYKIAAATIHGETPVGTAGTTASGNATLTTTNFNRLSIPSTPGASTFNIYKYNGATYDYIASVAAAASGATTFDDNGSYPALSNGSVSVNTTGWRINLGATTTNVVQVRSLDTTPIPPYGVAANTMVEFTIPAAKSQVQNLSGS